MILPTPPRFQFPGHRLSWFPLQWKHRTLTTGLPGNSKSKIIIFYHKAIILSTTTHNNLIKTLKNQCSLLGFQLTLSFFVFFFVLFLPPPSLPLPSLNSFLYNWLVIQSLNKLLGGGTSKICKTPKNYLEKSTDP